MSMASIHETPQPGDRIVFKRSDGHYDVLGVTENFGERVLRPALSELRKAFEIARSELEDGRLWYRDHATPHVTEPY